MSKENDPLGIFPDYDLPHGDPDIQSRSAMRKNPPSTQAEAFGQKATAILMHSLLGIVMILMVGGAWNLIKWLF